MDRLKTCFASILCIVCMWTTNAQPQTTEQPVRKSKTPEGVEYGVWGKALAKPAPILFVLSGTIDGTLGKAYFRQCGNELAADGFLCVSIDLPCHGSQAIAGQPSGIGGWSFRTAKKDDFVAESNQRLTNVLDHLIDSGIADPERIAVCGTSRGGFLAIHFMAHDDRVKCAAAFAPATDLAALREFQSIADAPFVETLSLVTQANALAGRPVWIVIGDQDERVGTGHAVDLAKRLTEAAKEKNLDSAVELHVMPEPRGHTTPHGSSQRAAKWIRQQMPAHATAADVS